MDTLKVTTPEGEGPTSDVWTQTGIKFPNGATFWIERKLRGVTIAGEFTRVLKEADGTELHMPSINDADTRWRKAIVASGVPEKHVGHLRVVTRLQVHITTPVTVTRTVGD